MTDPPVEPKPESAPKAIKPRPPNRWNALGREVEWWLYGLAISILFGGLSLFIPPPSWAETTFQIVVAKVLFVVGAFVLGFAAAIYCAGLGAFSNQTKPPSWSIYSVNSLFVAAVACAMIITGEAPGPVANLLSKAQVCAIGFAMLIGLFIVSLAKFRQRRSLLNSILEIAATIGIAVVELPGEQHINLQAESQHFVSGLLGIIISLIGSIVGLGFSLGLFTLP